MPDTPKIENAPGLVLRPRKDGWECRWQARTDKVKAGFTPKSSAICHIGPSPNESERNFISDRCNALQSEMLAFGKETPTVAAFDGSLGSLINCYQIDTDSPFHKLRFKSRENYLSLMRRLTNDCGDTPLIDINARTLLRWHESWTGVKSRIAMAHSLVGMLRTLMSFGSTILDNAECRRLKTMLGDMRFTMPKARTQRITAEQVNAVRAKAHELGKHSIALAQAFQFECILRQKDVVGEWVPAAEPGISEITDRGQKWLRGLRWSEIDGNLILKHTTSKRNKDVEVDLKLAPMVMEELERFPVRPQSGPVIVYEVSGLPYQSAQFRKVWRLVATAAGVPESVYNMDSRAGAISEATDAGVPIEHVRHASTHSNTSTTERYSRNQAGKTKSVQLGRVEHRKNKA